MLSLWASVYCHLRNVTGKPNRLNDIIPLLRGKWLNENEPNMKMILKAKIQETFSAK